MGLSGGGREGLKDEVDGEGEEGDEGEGGEEGEDEESFLVGDVVGAAGEGKFLVEEAWFLVRWVLEDGVVVAEAVVEGVGGAGAFELTAVGPAAWGANFELILFGVDFDFTTVAGPETEVGVEAWFGGVVADELVPLLGERWGLSGIGERWGVGGIADSLAEEGVGEATGLGFGAVGGDEDAEFVIGGDIEIGDEVDPEAIMGDNFVVAPLFDFEAVAHALEAGVELEVGGGH